MTDEKTRTAWTTDAKLEQAKDAALGAHDGHPSVADQVETPRGACFPSPIFRPRLKAAASMATSTVEKAATANGWARLKCLARPSRREKKMMFIARAPKRSLYSSKACTQLAPRFCSLEYASQAKPLGPAGAKLCPKDPPETSKPSVRAPNPRLRET